ncbi:zinc ABC transporter substrate-binding protein [Thalassospira sp. MA62]|nr:zinc ABC transporter substrate-binding protein [Thalassospira sp. MA62]
MQNLFPPLDGSNLMFSLPVSTSRRLFKAALVSATMIAAPVLPAFAQSDEAPAVVTSIKPIYGLASALMAGVGEPDLLIKGASSPHTYSLRPSEASTLQEADLIIYVSHTLEGFLEKPLESVAGNADKLELITVDDLILHRMREGGNWEAHDHSHEGHDHHHDHDDEDDHDHEHEHEHAEHDHDHEHEHEHEHEHAEHDHEHEHGDEAHHHGHDEFNPHIWMDPENGAHMATAIAHELAEIDPDHADIYNKNLKNLLASIDTLGDDLNQKLAPVKSEPFVVFHDAYQYLEAGFGLNGVGSITVSPDQAPGAKRLHEIEDKIRDTGAKCVFAEPQFRPAIVKAIVADTGARIGTLDPLGADIPAGPDAYQQIITQNVDALVDCLGASD